jgi:hypothetical protein
VSRAQVSECAAFGRQRVEPNVPGRRVNERSEDNPFDEQPHADMPPSMSERLLIYSVTAAVTVA